MGFPLAEILRIAAIPIGAAVPGGQLIGPGLIALANEIDKEDEPGTPEAVRRMKRKRREDWIKYGLNLEKNKIDRLKKYPEAARPSISKTLSAANGADIRTVIKASILESEDRIPSDREVNLYAEAVAARVREKL